MKNFLMPSLPLTFGAICRQHLPPIADMQLRLCIYFVPMHDIYAFLQGNHSSPILYNQDRKCRHS